MGLYLFVKRCMKWAENLRNVRVYKDANSEGKFNMKYRIPLANNSLGTEEIDAAMSVLTSGFVTQGVKVSTFEKMLSDMHNVKHAILVNSGSSANLVGIEALVNLSRQRPDLLMGPILPGDEVIIQGLNWPSTLKPIVNMGLTPVFSDVDLENLNSSVSQIEKVFTEKTKLVIAVPVLGNTKYLDELEDFCNQKGVPLFVDGCESFGAHTSNGRILGSFGVATAFSFYFSHHITTIEGGVILTDSDYIADLCFALRAHGWSRNLKLEEFLDIDSSKVDPRFCFVLPGYNVRSTDLNAAIGIEQLKKFPYFLNKRKQIAKDRINNLVDLSHLVTVPGKSNFEGHSWMAFPLLFNNFESKVRVLDGLEKAGIETRPIIVGNMLRHPLASNISMSSQQSELPNCDQVFSNGLMIGLDPLSSTEDENWLNHQIREIVTSVA